MIVWLITSFLANILEGVRNLLGWEGVKEGVLFTMFSLIKFMFYVCLLFSNLIYTFSGGTESHRREPQHGTLAFISQWSCCWSEAVHQTGVH